MRKAIGSLALVALFVTGAIAQEQPQQEGAPAQEEVQQQEAQRQQPQQQRAQQQARPQGASQQGVAQQGAKLDEHIAACLLLANQEEVALATFAKERCQSEECKQFAQTLIDNHQQALAKIEQAAPRLPAEELVLRNTSLKRNARAENRSTRQADALADAQPEDRAEDRGDDQAAIRADAAADAQADAQADARTERQPAAGADRAAARAGQAATLEPSLMLARQIKEECLAASVTSLEEKEGAEFDRCFIDQQVMAHKLMTAQLKGSEPFASAQLKPIIQQSLKTTESHLAKAEELQKKLTKESDGAAAKE